MDDSSEPTLDALLARFCGQDEAKAARAFEALAVLTRRGLHGYLRGKLHSEEAREDVIQQVLLRIWSRRSQFENRGGSAWWSLIKLAADQCRVDLVRKIGAEIAWDESEMGSVPNEDLPAMDLLIESMEDRESLYRFADELWLGFDPSTTERERARRVLAAHLYYCQRFTWEEICSLLNRGNYGPQVTRAQLDTWLLAPSTIRCLAFRSLYVDNDRLTSHLLHLPDGDQHELDRICRIATTGGDSEDPPLGWTWTEVRAIVWRYREADRNDKILARDLCTLDKTELKALFDRCLPLFPFLEIMKRLSADLATWSKARKQLTETTLWQRLVFEYFCRDTTHHRDILDRTYVAAELAPYNLTLGMLNVWLSNGRLMNKLASYVQTKRSSK